MSSNVRKIVFAGLIGALYAAITMAPPFALLFSYGPIQFRIAEALCILPFFFPFTAPGLFIGCLVANLLSPYGMLDVIAGSFATLLAVYTTVLIGHYYRKHSLHESKSKGLFLKIAACAPPVVFNAVIIGALIAWFETNGGSAFFPAMVTFGLQVGFGELVVMYVLGLPLTLLLPGTRLYKMLSAQAHLQM